MNNIYVCCSIYVCIHTNRVFTVIQTNLNKDSKEVVCTVATTYADERQMVSVKNDTNVWFTFRIIHECGKWQQQNAYIGQVYSKRLFSLIHMVDEHYSYCKIPVFAICSIYLFLVRHFLPPILHRFFFACSHCLNCNSINYSIQTSVTKILWNWNIESSIETIKE